MLTESSTRLRLEPGDEFMHENTGEPRYNESMYFNWFDAKRRLGGFVRIGNRPNESHAEVSLCLFQPDGSVLFRFERPEIEGNHAFDAGGMRFRVDEPFERLHVAYDGSACHLREPQDMADPRRAFRSNPFVPVRLELEIRSCGPVHGGEPQHRESADPLEFARGHYEQHHRASGWVEIDRAPVEVDGLGLRDHSWGPRTWQGPACYRWLTANFTPDFGWVGSRVVRRDGSEIQGGFVHRGRERVSVRRVEIDTDYDERTRTHTAMRARLHCSDGEHLDVEGRVLSLIPLRNRRDGRVTRIAEGMTEWTCQGLTGYGLSEYLDQIEG